MQFSNPSSSQRGFTETPILNNETFPTTGTHIHSITDTPIIKDVWEDNFEQEFKEIMHLAEKYKVIAMDTEFPGIVYRLNENDLESISNYHEIEYRTIKMNVDQLKVIQVGISVADEDGFMPPGVGTWQFNFRFDLNNDLYLKESIEMLSEAGIKFDQHATKGIDPQLFSEYLIASGIFILYIIRVRVISCFSFYNLRLFFIFGVFFSLSILYVLIFPLYFSIKRKRILFLFQNRSSSLNNYSILIFSFRIGIK